MINDSIPEIDFTNILRDNPHLANRDNAEANELASEGTSKQDSNAEETLEVVESDLNSNPDQDADVLSNWEQHSDVQSGINDDSFVSDLGIPEFDYGSLLKANPHLQSKVAVDSTKDIPKLVSTTDNLSSKRNKSQILGSPTAIRGHQRLSKKNREPQIIHLLKKVDLETTTFSIILPIFSLLRILFAPPEWNWTLVKVWAGYYMLTQLSLHAGYHRFFTHQSYQCHIAVQFVMAILGASCGLGSILQFSSQHLAHHRYLDTERDPNCLSLYGWWFAQWGHKLFRGNRKSARSIKDCLNTLESTSRASYNKEQNATEIVVSASYPLLKWQERNYYQLWILTNILIPSLFAKLICNLSYFSCIFYLGLFRMSVVQQQWLLIGSLCHLKRFPFASQPFDCSRSAVNLPLGFLAQILTFGESNHNFHHAFPGDYRNGAAWYGFDPAKWAIQLLAYFGWARNLHTVLNEQMKKSIVQQHQKILDEERSKLLWGISFDSLPVMSPEQFSELAQKLYKQDRRALVVIEDIVHDVTPFIHDHPGGVALVVCAIGKDATPAFNGAVYAHSTAARNLLATMRIAKLSKDGSSIQRTSWERHLLNDSKGQKIVRSSNQATYTRINHYAAGAA
ncbi:acyl-CoA desaturase Ecym_3180 [Eremothecium cymbalariae DBVPG|uniref:Cytochrome b5 heme-binding domain-containing protein n=1 Tax=Eremothecium cymbalariae (strain CBS 270.75 / DBVPG 7215 / KCTC 17166 / NRRL Y-17582) TaxID=931890 RepID=G8JRB1_ERECY|nr:Hypothetical protein Ecym_3180 [Eremothecium cymbalariae DBVPG\